MNANLSVFSRTAARMARGIVAVALVATWTDRAMAQSASSSPSRSRNHWHPNPSLSRPGWA